MGGSKAYVIVTGGSMAPAFELGDLVIVHRAPVYFVGDVVAYQDPHIGPVFHRIIDYYGDRFVLQGDNNHWVDPFFPKPDEVIGKYWFRLPGIGNFVRVLREPTNYAIMVVVFVAITFFPRKKSKSPQGKRRKPKKKDAHMITQRGRFYEIVISFGLVAVFALFFVIFSFTKPTTRVVEQQAILNHLGVFEYSADAVEGIYDNPTASSGDPVFLSISDKIDVQFDYKLGADSVAQIQGTYEIIAQISDDTGWKRTFKLTPNTPFEGNSFSASGSVNFLNVGRVINKFERITGISQSGFDLVVTPKITVFGTFEDDEITDQFSPTLRFRMNESLVWMRIGEDDTDPFTETKVSSLGVPVIEPNTVGFFTSQVPVLTIRILSVIIFIAVFAVGGWYGWKLYLVTGKGEYEQIKFYYGSEIIHLTKRPTYENLIELQAFEGLVDLAKSYGVKILHVYHRKKHHFFLPLEEGVYIYKIGSNGGKT
jgi:signal peptidase